MEKIRIFDTTLRDGEQAPGYSMNIEEKIRMARQLEALGVDVLEAGFAIASPGDFASVKAISEAVSAVTVASLSRALVKDIDANFVKAVRPGDVLVAGRNFGCGSSREHAPIAIKASGVACVIAASFARIFYRNALNVALPILECPEAASAIAAGDAVSVDFETGRIVDETTGCAFTAEPFPPFMRELIAAGGLAAYLSQKGRTSEGKGGACA